MGIRKDESGATLIYVTICMAVFIGMVGFAIDFARLQSLDSQLQDAADAAALAAATQLDGRPGAQARATAAAKSTPLVTNTRGENNATNVTIESVAFYKSLPASDSDALSDAATSDRNSEFVEVVTASTNHTNLFLPVLGVGKNRAITASAVAGQESVICRVTPLAICNPNEETAIGAAFNVQDWQGRQILVRMSGANSQWAPGNFGLLDTPNGGQGAPELAHMLAAVEGADECFSTRLNTKPGQVASLRSALNTRFDMYENPFFKNDSGNEDYPPAPNVTKGYVESSSPGSNLCKGDYEQPGAPVAVGLPRDASFTDAVSSDGRFGNGDWDCRAYWDVNHPSEAYPSGCTSSNPTLSRWDLYNYELDAPSIPGVDTPSTESGAPQCYSGSTPGTRERRLVNFAVMNCLEHNVRGNETGVPAEAFVRAFLTEPVGDETSPGNGDFDVYLEIVDVLEPGANNGPLREYVEVFR
ncbi:MAG: pilus assembly protein TadG-related protein [Henriciella sp.]